MNKKKTELWENVQQMAVNTGIPDKERVLYLNAQTSLEDGAFDEKVAQSLQRNLSRIAMTSKLSESGVQLLTRLSDLYMGYGRRDNLSL